MPEPTDKIRATIAERLIAIGATDDDGTGLFEWHPCTDREACTTVMDPPSPCPCAGRPYLNDQVWTAITEAFESAGRLLPEGGQTRTEWGTAGKVGDLVIPAADEASALRVAGRFRGSHVVRRTVVDGPWVAVDREATDG